MENAVDGLKLGFAVLVFIIALSMAMVTFSQAKAVADIVFYSSDKTNFYEIEEGNSQDTNNGRIVGIESIIPTCYRTSKENIQVVIDLGNEDIIINSTDAKKIIISTNLIKIILPNDTETILNIAPNEFEETIKLVLQPILKEKSNRFFLETFTEESTDKYTNAENDEKLITQRGITTTIITYTEQN